jgi:hypothetical protein
VQQGQPLRKAVSVSIPSTIAPEAGACSPGRAPAMHRSNIAIDRGFACAGIGASHPEGMTNRIATKQLFMANGLDLVSDHSLDGQFNRRYRPDGAIAYNFRWMSLATWWVVAMRM